MSVEDGNGDGDTYLSIASFNRFKEDNAALCKSYREHVETKITSLDEKMTNTKKSIQWTISICVAVSTIIIMLVQWYLTAKGV